MSEISETEIKSMTKEQNYMRGYEDGKSDVLDKIKAEIEDMGILSASDAHGMIYEGHCRHEEVLAIIDKYKAEEKNYIGYCHTSKEEQPQ